MKNYEEEYKAYKKVFKKYGVSITEMTTLQMEIEKGEMEIECVQEYFERPVSKWIPTETKTEIVDAEFYMNCISSIPIFKDRVTRTATKFGTIPTELVAYSWGTGNTKVKRTFNFKEV